MPAQADPIGSVLMRGGMLSEDTLSDLLEQQRRSMPLGSLCYVLGYLDEESLARALSRQLGMPALVLDRSVIRLEVLEALPREVAMRHNVLPVYEDDQRIFMAAAAPHAVRGILRELRFVSGKTPVMHAALHVTLARTVRASYAARDRGERMYAGSLVDPGPRDPRGYMAVVSGLESAADEARVSAIAGSSLDDVTRELELSEQEALQALSDEVARTTDTTQIETTMEEEPVRSLRTPTLDGTTDIGGLPLASPDRGPVIDLDAGEGASYAAGHAGPRRVLIVDDDFASRHLLVKLLQPLGILTVTSATGGEAIRQLKANPPDIAIVDVMLPEVDGFQICRAIKQSRKYGHIAVVLMSAVIESARITDEVLARYGAAAYFEKPLDTGKLEARIQELLAAGSGETAPAPARDDDPGLERALALYKSGDIDGAIAALRIGLQVDPLSAKHHFVLANLLQRKSLFYEAIDEYEATVELKPDYFPALTRLAYLYYKQGFAAQAVDTWRRSLPLCPDEVVRRNIEGFVEKIVHDNAQDPESPE